MSSNRPIRALRALLIAATAASAAACASAPPPAPLDARAGKTPTEQFVPEATARRDQIMLAPHTDGLSNAQVAALSALVDRWREKGGGQIVIQAPSHGGGGAFATANNVEAELGALGVRDDSIRVEGYAGDDQHPAPIVVGFNHYEAKVPTCGLDWSTFTTEISNRPMSNFGCAVTANVAAMVANPADLVQARPMDPPDAGRREAVLSKYRSGAVTSSPKDDQADTQISDAVH